MVSTVIVPRLYRKGASPLNPGTRPARLWSKLLSLPWPCRHSIRVSLCCWHLSSKERNRHCTSNIDGYRCIFDILSAPAQSEVLVIKRAINLFPPSQGFHVTRRTGTTVLTWPPHGTMAVYDPSSPPLWYLLSRLRRLLLFPPVQ